MARPKPTIIIEHHVPQTYKIEQVLESEAIFAVFYDGNPVNIRTINTLIYSGPKYRKVSFSNKGHAVNLAKRLNKQFKSTLFAVYKLTNGTPI
jgi:hypothetical protein